MIYAPLTEKQISILVQQCYKAISNESYKSTRIISDDTDVFLLACYHYSKVKTTVYMEPTKKRRAVTNIGQTTNKYKDIVPFLPQADAVSGSHSVARCHDIGKASD